MIKEGLIKGELHAIGSAPVVHRGCLGLKPGDRITKIGCYAPSGSKHNPRYRIFEPIKSMEYRGIYTDTRDKKKYMAFAYEADSGTHTISMIKLFAYSVKYKELYLLNEETSSIGIYPAIFEKEVPKPKLEMEERPPL